MKWTMTLLTVCFLSSAVIAGDPPKAVEKMNGVNFVAPVRKVGGECFVPLQRINSEWVALNPFAYGTPGSTTLKFDISWQWWGERIEGVRAMLDYAKDQKLKVMIKPHIWVKGEGWPGDFELESDKAWKEWEKNYKAYVMAYAQIAEEYNVEVFCLGTEVRKSVRFRSAFWFQLIKDVRQVYHGKITYASNWDNFESVPFWKELDFIGIDCYFPVSEEKQPSVDQLLEGWKPFRKQIRVFAEKQGVPVIFTEYGYRSIERTSWKQWLLPEHWEDGDEKVSLLAQVNAYDAIFRTFWNEPWFAGGFLWKWYADDKGQGGTGDRDYTPQNKPVEKLIYQWYKK